MQRLAPLLTTLARHGFGHLIERMNLQHLVPVRWRGGLGFGEGEEAHVMPMPVRLRRVLEEWGPTAIKLGQMLSTRPDLIPDAYVKELRRLTDRVPPFDPALARAAIEHELGRPMDQIFREFTDAPIAAGSIAQVHHAVLPDGRPVVVKVRRPDIDRIMLADLDLLETVAVPFLEWIEDLRPLRPAMIVEEFRRTLMQELDFVAEASVTQSVREDLAEEDIVVVPMVHWDLTTSKVLTLERIRGVSLNDTAGLVQLETDRKRLARNLARVFFTQFFKTGLFHADPHPGNLLVTPEGRLALLDFGMAGRLDRELRNLLGVSLIAITLGDMELLTDAYLEIGVISDETDQASLRNDLGAMLDRYYGVPMRCLDMNRCFTDAMRIARAHNVFLPRDFVLLGKSLGTMVMMARELDPEFDLAEVARPFSASLIAHRLSPEQAAREAVSGLWNLSQMFRRMPHELRTFSRKLVSGRLQLQLQHRMSDFDAFAREMDRATNRLAFSVLVASIVVGSALVLQARIPPYVSNALPGDLGAFFARNMPDVSLLGLGGFLFAGVLGLLLAVAIWRHGRL